MAVRLFVGNLSYGTTEADLRTYFGSVAPPSQIVLPVDRETGRPRGFAFVEFTERAHAEDAIQRFNGQVFNGRPLAVPNPDFVPFIPGTGAWEGTAIAGHFAGLPVFLDPAVPTNLGGGTEDVIVVFRPSDCRLWRREGHGASPV